MDEEEILDSSFNTGGGFDDLEAEINAAFQANLGEELDHTNLSEDDRDNNNNRNTSQHAELSDNDAMEEDSAVTNNPNPQAPSASSFGLAHSSAFSAENHSSSGAPTNSTAQSAQKSSVSGSTPSLSDLTSKPKRKSGAGRGRGTLADVSGVKLAELEQQYSRENLTPAEKDEIRQAIAKEKRRIQAAIARQKKREREKHTTQAAGGGENPEISGHSASEKKRKRAEDSEDEGRLEEDDNVLSDSEEDRTARRLREEKRRKQREKDQKAKIEAADEAELINSKELQEEIAAHLAKMSPALAERLKHGDNRKNFNRIKLNPGNMQRIITAVTGSQKIPANITATLVAVSKMFIGQLYLLSKLAQGQLNHDVNAALRPVHINEAYRIMSNEGNIPTITAQKKKIAFHR
jgi:hypothetical protein